MSESSPHPETLSGLAEFLEIHAEPMRTGPDLTENQYSFGSKPDGAIEVHVIYPDAVLELIQRSRLALDFLTEAEPQLPILEDHDPNNHSHSAYLALRELLRTAIKRVRARSMMRLPRTPQKYKELIVAAVRTLSGASVGDASCRSADTESTKTNERDMQQDVEEKLPPYVVRAYRSFQLAEQKMPETPETDRDAYDWLKENLSTDYEYKLPEFHTWQRYVRRGRKHNGTQKNTPRAGREGRSIVKVSRI